MSTFATIRRSFASEEAYWFWTLGRWDMAAGFYQGLGIAVVLRRGEWELTLGPFSVGGVRR